MWALFAFIALGLLTATLIEINERIKAKRNRDHEITVAQEDHEDCEKKQACSECGLVELCNKKSDSEKLNAEC